MKPTTALRTHYLINGKARCGKRAWNHTTDPEKVTCGVCKRLMRREVE